MESGRDPSENGPASGHRGAIVVLPTVAAGSRVRRRLGERRRLGDRAAQPARPRVGRDPRRSVGSRRTAAGAPPPRRSHRRRDRAGTVGSRSSRTPHAKTCGNGDGHGPFTSTRRARGAAPTSPASGNATSCSTPPVRAWLGRSACRRSCSCPHRWSGRPKRGVCDVPAGATGPNWPVSGPRYGPPTSSPADRRQLPNRFDARSRRPSHRDHTDRRRSGSVPVASGPRRCCDAVSASTAGSWSAGSEAFDDSTPSTRRSMPSTASRVRRCYLSATVPNAPRSNVSHTSGASRCTAPHCRTRRRRRLPRGDGRGARARVGRPAVPLLAAQARRVLAAGVAVVAPASGRCPHSCATASTRSSSPRATGAGWPTRCVHFATIHQA